MGISMVVQWLRLHTSNAGAAGSVPGRGTKIPQGVEPDQKKKKILLDGRIQNGSIESTGE